MRLGRVREPVQPCDSGGVVCRELAEYADTLPQGQGPGLGNPIILFLISGCHQLQFLGGERVPVLNKIALEWQGAVYHCINQEDSGRAVAVG